MEEVSHLFRWRWHKPRIFQAGMRRANEDLVVPEFARPLVLTAHALHQDLVHLIHEPKRDGQPLQAVYAMIQCACVIDNFAYVVLIARAVLLLRIPERPTVTTPSLRCEMTVRPLGASGGESKDSGSGLSPRRLPVSRRHELPYPTMRRWWETEAIPRQQVRHERLLTLNCRNKVAAWAVDQSLHKKSYSGFLRNTIVN